MRRLLLLAIFFLWAAARPIGVDALPVHGGATSSSVALTNFTVQAAGSVTADFAFAGPLPKGAVMPGNITTDADSYQVIVKRTWNDGSVKHYFVEGSEAITSGAARVVHVSTGTTPSGTNKTCADITAANPSASVDFGGTYGAVTLSSLFSTPYRTWLNGQFYVECHYMAQASGGGPLVWFHVGLWASGRMWVLVAVENTNGSVTVATTDKSFVPTVAINGSNVYAPGSSQTLYANTRWKFEGWIGGNQGVVIQHNMADVIKTKLVPNYYMDMPSATALNALCQTYVPNGNCGWTTDMGTAGDQPQIAWVPRWDADLITSQEDSRAVAAALAASAAGGSYQIVWRGATDNWLPVRPSVYTTNTQGPGTTGGGLRWEYNHDGSMGYMAYLLYGRYFDLETMEFNAAAVYMFDGGGGDPGHAWPHRSMAQEVRGFGWAVRTVAQMTAVIPSADLLLPDYQTFLAYQPTSVLLPVIQTTNVNHLGEIYEYDLFNSADGVGFSKPWEQHYLSMAFGMGSDLEPLASSDMTNFNTVRDWLSKISVGLLGDASGSNYCAGYAGDYAIQVASAQPPSGNYTTVSPGTFFDNWGTAWTTTHPSASCPNSYQGSIYAGNYLDYMLPDIVSQVDHAETGASASYGRMTAFTNWSSQRAVQPDDPRWAMQPR